MKKTHIIILAILSLAFLPSCADHAKAVIECFDCHTYGFWAGIWHGFIAPFDFIGSLIWDDVTVYAQDNNGGWYSFGFLLGIGALGSSGGITIKASRK